jgi:hypothetical protein
MHDVMKTCSVLLFQISVGCILVPGADPFALVWAKAFVHSPLYTKSSYNTNTLAFVVAILWQKRSQTNCCLISTHRDLLHSKNPFIFTLSLSLSSEMPSALYWHWYTSLQFAQCPKEQLNNPVKDPHSEPLLQLYFFSAAGSTCRKTYLYIAVVLWTCNLLSDSSVTSETVVRFWRVPFSDDDWGF